MGEIKIVTASRNDNMRPMLDKWIERVEKLSYDYEVYNLGGLDFGIDMPTGVEDLSQTHNHFPPCTFKPRVIKNALEDDKLIIWMDVDALLVDRIDELKEDSFDIGLTRRRESEIRKSGHKSRVGEVNLGVCFFRSNDKVEDFIDRWTVKTDRLNNDQHAMNQLIKHTDLEVKYYPTDEYNNYYFDGSAEKVIHYRGRSQKVKEGLRELGLSQIR